MNHLFENIREFTNALKAIAPLICAEYRDNSRTRMMAGENFTIHLTCATTSVELRIITERTEHGSIHEVVGFYSNGSKFSHLGLLRDTVFRVAENLFPPYTNTVIATKTLDVPVGHYAWVYQDRLKFKKSVLVTPISENEYRVNLYSKDMLEFLFVTPCPNIVYTDSQIEAALETKVSGLEWSEHEENMFKRRLTMRIPGAIIHADSVY